MILPTKHLSLRRSMLGAGALLLEMLGRPRTISSLWDAARKHSEIGSYERFVLVLDFLFAVGAIDLADGLLRRGDE